MIHFLIHRPPALPPEAQVKKSDYTAIINLSQKTTLHANPKDSDK